MTAKRLLAATAAILGCLVAPARAQWVRYAEEPSRLVAASDVGAGDTQEKEYAWGDVDGDGDIDLVAVRKEPFTTPGRRVNVLFMNEDGVLVDRTAEYATASDVKGDLGFLTPTNDRDVVLVDVDLDGWLDIVTAPTLTDNAEKHISHPRVYMNLGESAGLWQGFEHQNARIPLMHPTAGPRFCSVAAGDVTLDGYPDLYFGDYDSGGPEIFDFNNRLFINDGTGHFVDETALRLTPEMSQSAFGASSVIADMNGDGAMDVVKQTSLNAPLHVAVTYNNPLAQGMFDRYHIVNENAPYFVSVGDLNNDGLLDMALTDDGTDRYLLNQGNDAQGRAIFSTTLFVDSGGFGGDSVIADLNNDGHQDVLITDVDVDIAGCTRTTFIYRNMGDVPGVSFQKQGEPIPNSQLIGVHDAAIFDLNGDGWLDIVLGRCTGTQVWMNQPPVGLIFSFPGGLPSFLTPGEATPLTVEVAATGGGAPKPGTGKIHVSIGGGPFQESDMSGAKGNFYATSLPALACATRLRFYFEAELDGGGVYFDPSAAPAQTYTAVSATGLTQLLREEFEAGPNGWTVLNGGPVNSGAWELADPNATIFGGVLASPEDDATQGASFTTAFVTGEGEPGGAPGAADLDGGPTRLLSPPIDLAGTDAIVTYARWFFSGGGSSHTPDSFTVDVSGDGGKTWTAIPEHTSGGTGSAWETVSFVVSEYVTPTAEVRVRFTASDVPNDSVTEAGIDNFQVEVFDCGAPPACPGDLDDDGEVDVPDLVTLILAWGLCPKGEPCAADLNDDGEIDVLDLVALVLLWGPCP